MTERQEKKLKMYLAVLEVCARHRFAWQELPAFANAHQEFASRVEIIRDLADKHSRHTGGVAETKRDVRQRMCIAAHEIAATTRACAMAAQRSDLAQSIDFSLTDLRIGKDVLCLEKCRRVCSAAQELLPAMGGYGTTPAKIPELQQLIEEFGAILNRPREIRDANKGITARLPCEFEAADAVLCNHLDNLLLQFRSSHARFHSLFQESRNMSREMPRSIQVQPSEEGTLD